MVDQYAVIGNPVEHSKSPLIHTLFAEQTGQSMQYERVLAPLDDFSGTVAALRQAGLRGANVTVPFKFEACQLAGELTPRARAARAVNTLIFSGQQIFGDNTDGVGLIRDIQRNLGVALAGQRVLLVGAGGAAEGVLRPLLEQRPLRLIVANRTLSRAQAMVGRVEAHEHARGMLLQAVSFKDLNGLHFDVVINATAASLYNSELPLPLGLLTADALAYDMMYGRETSFMAWARGHGARVADGLGMLVEQAAESFYLWRQVRPQTAPVIAHLRA